MLSIEIVSIALALAGSAAASPAKNDKADVGDPNRKICRYEETTGSRLGKSKRCMTAAEWAEIKRLDKADIEKIQANRYKDNE